MSKIISFLYCESSQNDLTPAGPKLHLIGPMLKLSPMFIPSMFSFSILINIGDMDINSSHILRFVFKSPKGEEASIIDTGDVIIQIPDDIDPADEIHALMLNMDFRNIPLRHKGVYKGQVYFDKILLGEYPIMAKVVEAVWIA